MDYFVASGYLEDVEDNVAVDALHGVVSTSNITSCNSDFIFTESYQAAATLLYTSNLVSSNIQTTKLISSNASFCNLAAEQVQVNFGTFSNLTAWQIQSSNAITSNLVSQIATLSNVYSEYVKSTKITGSNVFFNQLVDLGGHVVVDSNSKLSWSNLKDIPESDGGLSLFDIASAAYDGLQTISDLYDKLKGLTQDVPELPEEISNPLKDALGSNESSNPIYVDWSKLISRPIATTTDSFDVGFKSDVYVSDASRMFSIAQGRFSQDNGNLHNTKTASNLVLDFASKTAYLDKVQLYGACNSMTIQSNCITAPVILLNSNTSVTSNGLTTQALVATSVSAPDITTNEINSACNLTLRTSNFLQLTSCNLNVSQSNLTWIQQTSNPNPFLDPYATTGISLNTSNIVLKNLQSNQTTFFIQDPASFKLLFSKSNGSNVTNSTILFDSNQGVSGISNLLLNGDLLNPTLYTSCNSLVVTSNIFSGGYILANGDLACSNVVRTSWMQLRNSLPINKTTYAEGLYSRSAKPIIDQDGDGAFSNMTVAGTLSVSNTFSCQSNVVVAGSLTAPVLTSLSNSINSVSNQVILLCNSLSNYTLLTSTFSLSNDIYAKNTSNIASLVAYSNAVTPVVTSTSNTQYTISNFLYRYTPSNDANITSLSSASIYNSNALVSLSNFSTQNNVWTSNNLISLSNFSTSNNVWTSNSLVALSNFSTTNNAWSSNNLVALSNFSTSNNAWTSNNRVALSNFGTTNNAWASNNLVSLSNFSTSNHFYNSNLNIYNSNMNSSNLARVVWTSNSAVFGCNCAMYSSNSLNSLATTATVTVLSNTFSNYRAKSATVLWTEVSGKPDFSSDGAGNDSLGAASVTIGSAGLLMSGYNLLDKNGKITNALSDAFGKMTIDPTGYFKLNDPGSYIDIGDSTTRVSKDRLLFKTGTFSNMILNPQNLSYSNAIFSLCNQISLTATSISNLTHVSCSSNLTVLRSASVGGLTCTGLSMNHPSTTNIVASTLFTPYLNSNQYMLNVFGQNTGVVYNAGFHGVQLYSNNSQSNYAAFGIYGYTIGSGTINACGTVNSESVRRV
jgi:hypothetical protein